jgi:hypothetical protein
VNGPTPECTTALRALARGGGETDWDAVDRHLASCERCATGFERLTAAIDEQFAASGSLDGADEQTDVTPSGRIVVEAPAPLPFRPPRRRRLWSSPRTLAVLLAAAATMAVFAGAVVLGSLSSGSPSRSASKSVAKQNAEDRGVASGSVASGGVAQQQPAVVAAQAAQAGTAATGAPAAAAAPAGTSFGQAPAASAAAAARPATPAALAAAAATRAATAAPSSAGNPLVGVAEADRRPEFVPSLEVLPDRPDHTYFSGEQIQVCLSINQPSRIHLSVLEGQTTFDLYDADSDPGRHCFPEKVGTIRGRATLRVEVFYGNERVAREDFPLLPAATPTPVP